MFENCINEIRETVKLSVLRESVYNDEAKKGLHESNGRNFFEYLKKINDYESTKIEKQLESVLQSLDEETLLQLQAVMYLGRDYDGSEDGTPKETYESLLNYLRMMDNNKDVIIEMISSKLPLGSYLKAGFFLLEVYL